MLRGFTELSPQVTQKAFEQFSARTIAVYPDIRALEWIPRVPASGRAKFEARLKAEESLRPKITESSPISNLNRAPDRAEYYSGLSPALHKLAIVGCICGWIAGHRRGGHLRRSPLEEQFADGPPHAGTFACERAIECGDR